LSVAPDEPAEPEPYRACEYLDGGACGIIAPYCETVAQVRRCSIMALSAA